MWLTSFHSFESIMESAKVGRALASLLLIEQTVPISSAEAERIFADEHSCYRLQVEVIGF